MPNKNVTKQRIMIDEIIEELNEKQKQRCKRLAEERYEALRNTITHLYGQAFLDELEVNVSGIISRSRYNDTITDRLSLLRKQYRTKCKISNPYNPIGKYAFRCIYERFKEMHQYNEKRDLNQMRKRSKVRQRYNELKRVIAIEFGDEVQKELIRKAKTLALADVIQKQKYLKFSYAKGYAENDLSFALRHLRILYAYTKWQREGIDGTHIHIQINHNYQDCMLDPYKN